MRSAVWATNGPSASLAGGVLGDMAARGREACSEATRARRGEQTGAARRTWRAGKGRARHAEHGAARRQTFVLQTAVVCV
jgi:hypothetical protein